MIILPVSRGATASKISAAAAETPGITAATKPTCHRNRQERTRRHVRNHRTKAGEIYP